MHERLFDRIKVLGWTLAFLSPVASMEIGRELRAAWNVQPYSQPTPEFAKAMAACDPSLLTDR